MRLEAIRTEGRQNMEKLVNIGVTQSRSFPANQLRVNVSLSDHRKDRNECTSEYNRLLAEVRDALIGIGIPAEDIKNSDFRVSTHWKTLYKKEDGSFYVHENVPDGYDFNAQISVVRDADAEEAKAIWKALSSCDDAVQFSLNYALKNEADLKSSLMADAVKEGRRRAEILAEASGEKISGIRSIDYGYDGGFGMRACYCESKVMFDEAPEFNPEDIEVSCDVRMQWAME